MCAVAVGVPLVGSRFTWELGDCDGKEGGSDDLIQSSFCTVKVMRTLDWTLGRLIAFVAWPTERTTDDCGSGHSSKGGPLREMGGKGREEVRT